MSEIVKLLQECVRDRVMPSWGDMQEAYEEIERLEKQVAGLRKLNVETAMRVPRDTRKCTGL